MLKTYFLLAFRNMQKNKLHTFINIGGMAVAFICSIFILMVVYHHFSFDDFERNKSSLFKVYHYAVGPNGEENGTSMAYPLTPALKTENIGISKATRIKERGRLVRYKDKTLDMGTTMVDNDFFSMFSFPVLKGALTNPLSDISNVVITEKTASKLFGEEDPLGKPIEVKMGGKWTRLTVSAVISNPPLNSTVKFSVLARSEIDPDYAEIKDNWNNQNHPVYVQIAGNTTRQQVESRLREFVKKYTPVDVADAKKDGYLPDRNGDYSSIRLIALKDIHFNSQLDDGNSISKAFLHTLLLISGVIILIASFNFINLNVGLSFTRTKEIGIRRYLGAEKQQIWLQTWGESFMMVVASMMLAIGCVILCINSFNHIFGNMLDSSMLYNPIVVATLPFLVILVSFIASGYPAAFMSKLKTIEVLKGKISVKRSGVLRDTLIVTQFVIAIVLICSTIIIYRQFNHLRSAPLGYNTSAIISIPIKNNEKGKEIVNQLRTRLASQASIVSVSGCNTNLGLGKDLSSSSSLMCFGYKGKGICGQIISGDYEFLKTLGIKPTEGHDFLLRSVRDTSHLMIATASYAAQFGEKTLAGFSFTTDKGNPPITIVGVIPDFQFSSIQHKQEPLVIELNKKENLGYAWIRVNSNNPIATMNMVKEVYATVEPGVEFKGSYVNENIDRWFKDEQNMARLFSVSAIVAIVLSCMGLFGIASIIIRQRVKEIGVRKILGASVNSIIMLVSKEFLKPVLIAMLIAVPVGWWAMQNWLQNYTYRTQVEWWVFMVAGITAVLITICTVSFQAVKAALANPVKSLRTE
jgi:ABC-type antimicrobial peptide transport system permease subunit